MHMYTHTRAHANVIQQQCNVRKTTQLQSSEKLIEMEKTLITLQIGPDALRCLRAPTVYFSAALRDCEFKCPSKRIVNDAKLDT